MSAAIGRRFGMLVLLVGCTTTPVPADVGRDATATDDASDDAGVDAPAPLDVGPDANADAGPSGCVPAPSPSAGSDAIDDTLGHASVAIDDRAACARTYTLTSTAMRRDMLPGNPRTFTEQDGMPTLRTGSDLFDALFALALDEVREASVASISDGAFDSGSALACPAGGCFETGRIWTYVWTRDTSFSVDLSLAPLDPTRALNSLSFKLSERRGGGGEQVVQDTGSGGSYPVSSDRIVWALGARAVLAELEGSAHDAFRDRAYDALARTLAHDREVVFDADTGLYRGETSFLDWREQTYPDFTAGDVVPIAESESLSTNVLHLSAIRTAQALADARGDVAERDRLAPMGDALATEIHATFWDDAAGELSAFTPRVLDRAPVRRRDLLGTSLAILAGVVDASEGRRALSAYPHFAHGAPVIAPQQQFTAIYHDRAQWPFVTAYEALAAARVGHASAMTHAVRTLVHGAALSLSNVENYELPSGLPWVDDGAYSGPVVSSQRQLWSVAGWIAMVSRGLFGLEATENGLALAPYLPADVVSEHFAGQTELSLVAWPARGHRVTVVLHLPASPAAAGGEYVVSSLRLDGSPAASPIPWDALRPESRIDVDLVASAGAGATLNVVDPSDWHDVYGPRTPAIASLAPDGGHLRVQFDLAGETPSDVTVAVYRDGARVADGLAGASGSYLDAAVDASAPRSPCYAIETCFASGNCSQHSAPACFWGATGERVTIVPATSFVATGGAPASDHGRFHYEAWGDAGHRLDVSGVHPTQTGDYLVQLTYGNGAGPISTGITCAVKRIVVEDEATHEIVGTGIVVMPQLGDWDRWAGSTLVPVTLDATRSYHIAVVGDDTTMNMSAMQHFARYTAGTGGASGAFERVNVSDLRLLAR